MANPKWMVALPVNALRNLFSKIPRDYGALATWLALYAHSDPEGKSFPSLRTLAEFVGMTKRRVHEAIKRLEAAGLLTKTNQVRDDGGNTVCVYRLHLEILVGYKCSETVEGHPRQQVATPSSTGALTDASMASIDAGVYAKDQIPTRNYCHKEQNTTPPTTHAQSNASRSDCAATNTSAAKDWHTLFEEQITEDRLDAIQKAFPSLDVRQEVNKMRAWLETHSDVARRRKRFDLMLWRWLHKAQKRQDRLKGGNAKQRLQQHLQELKARGLIEDAAEYEGAIKKITGIFVKALASLNPAIDAMEGEAYDRWFTEQMLEIALLDHQLSGALSMEDMLLVAEFLKQPDCKFAVGDARDLRQKWLRILPQARKWWRKYHGGDL